MIATKPFVEHIANSLISSQSSVRWQCLWFVYLFAFVFYPGASEALWTVSLFPLSFCFQVSKVSKAAQMATPSSRIVQLAKPRPPATLLEEWDPVPKPKPHALNYNRLLYLASK